MKHPALRVSSWQWIAPEYQALITGAIVDLAVPTLPFSPRRVELVGSLARGCGHLDSDFDINLAASDWEEQVEWRRLWGDLVHRRAFMEALRPTIEGLDIRIEVAPNNPDQHTYDLCFNFLTGELTDPRRAFPDLTSRWWDGYELLWRSRPLMAKELAFESDEWAADLDVWRCRYGPLFLDYLETPIPPGDGELVVRSDGRPATRLIANLPFYSIPKEVTNHRCVGRREVPLEARRD